MAKPKISHARLTALLDYDPMTGVFRWKVGAGRAGADSVAGCLNVYGYRQIGIDGCLYKAHALAWFYMHCRWAPGLDHRNGIGADNRLKNLRPATLVQNSQNAKKQARNTSGFKGVSFDKRARRWRTKIVANRIHHWIGLFDTPELAYAAYCRTAHQLHGEFARLR